MAAKKDEAKSALEQRKLELEIARLELEARKLEADALNAELTYAKEHEYHQVRVNNQRVIHVNDSIYGDSVAFCMTRLRDLRDLAPTRPIEIIINSPGGSVMDGFELYDFVMELRAGGTPINTTILGMGASMAGILSQAGEVRRIGTNSYFMVHEVASMSLGKLSSMKDAVKFSERLYDRLLGILVERSNLTIEEIKAKADRTDWWLDAKDALEAGFVDLIVPTPQIEVA